MRRMQPGDVVPVEGQKLAELAGLAELAELAELGCAKAQCSGHYGGEKVGFGAQNRINLTTILRSIC
jgi:hypothetical protein